MSGSPHYQGVTIALRHTLFDRAPIKRWTRRGDLCLTTFITHKKQTSMPQAGFEPRVPTSEQSQTSAFDGVAVGMTEICYSVT
jgi:hypothetical protein